MLLPSMKSHAICELVQEGVPPSMCVFVAYELYKLAKDEKEFAYGLACLIAEVRRGGKLTAMSADQMLSTDVKVILDEESTRR